MRVKSAWNARCFFPLVSPEKGGLKSVLKKWAFLTNTKGKHKSLKEVFEEFYNFVELPK